MWALNWSAPSLKTEPSWVSSPVGATASLMYVADLADTATVGPLALEAWDTYIAGAAGMARQ